MTIHDISKYQMGTSINTSSRIPTPPSTSPIKKHQTHDSAQHNLIRAENKIFNSTDHRISITSQVSHGDALMSICGAINTTEELQVVARYLVKFSHLPFNCPELDMCLAVLQQLRDRLVNYVDGAGGVEYIIQKNLERTFPEPGTTTYPHATNTQEDEFIQECARTIDQIKNVDKAITYITKMSRGMG